MFIVKSSTLFLLFIAAVGLWADKNLENSTRIIWSPIVTMLFVYLFWRWFASPLLKKKPAAIKTPTPFCVIPNESKERKQDNPLPSMEFSPTTNDDSQSYNAGYYPFNMADGKSVIWAGKTKPASFRLRSETERIEGVFIKLSIFDDGEFYLELMNQETGEVHTYKEQEINTKIVVGATRYDFVELCGKVFKLNLSEVFEYAKLVRKKASEPNLIASFQAINATFTYSSSSGTNRRSVDIDRYLRNGYGEDYIEGFCHMRKERRMFAVRNIKTMLASDGHKKYYFHDWLTNVVGMNNDVS